MSELENALLIRERNDALNTIATALERMINIQEHILSVQLMSVKLNYKVALEDRIIDKEKYDEAMKIISMDL